MEADTESDPTPKEVEQSVEDESNTASRMEGDKEPDPTPKELASGLKEECTTASRLENETDSSSRLEVETESSPWMEGDPAHKLPLCYNKDKTHKKSFVDDLTLLEKISLKSLVKDTPIIGPQPYHGRFNLIHPKTESVLQHQLDDLVVYTKENHMVLNSKKTKCMPFNNSKTRDFIPKLSVEEGTNLEVIYKLKLVGLVLTSDLSWKEHVIYTIGRVNKTIWQLVRFKQKGADMEKLVTFYTLKIRSILMFGSVCFHSSLTNEQSRKLELQQKRSLAVILGSNYRSYSQALSLTSLPRLDTLRQEACVKWALKAQANPQHADLFPLNHSTIETRHRLKFKEYNCKGAKFYNSAIPAMVRALNSHDSDQMKQPDSPSRSPV